MNRIILIGNGFDLAHGIKSSYNDFINDFWENTIKDIQKCTKTYFENDEIVVKPIPENWVAGYEYKNLIDSLSHSSCSLVYKNKFLEIINSKQQEQNWVDIENEYYSLLKKSFKEENCKYKINELNNDFNKIQKLLENYLKKVEEKFVEEFPNNLNLLRIKNTIGYKVYSDFKLKDFTETSINKKAEIEFQKIQKDIKGINDQQISLNELSQEKQRLISKINVEEPLKEIRKILISDGAINYFDLQPEEILFLNFNYTFTEKVYSNHNEFDADSSLTKKYIHIHGTTDEYDKNDVIFGFGDEIDEDYKSIENLNDNSYLENIKSIKYLESDNYKRLLEFLNGADYQIFIFGHSCGNSDRTLLSTLFEHKNCSSIKPFFHKRKDDTDNFSDIVRNITRNFSNKPTMRDKVVNKKYCESLS